MKKFKTMDGNEACAHVSYMFTEVAGIYPITPSSVMAEYVDDWSSNNVLNIFNDRVKVVEMQSEAGAAGMMHGSLQTGALTTTYTSSQGLLLMIPNMYKMAGEMLPGVMHVAARSLSTHALSILGDHQDIYAARMTGFAMIANSSVQQVMDLSAVSHLSAIKSSLPFMNFFDGFRTSHEIQKVEVLEKEDLKDLIDYDALNKFRNKALSLSNKVTRGTAANEDIYFQMAESRNKDYDELPDIVNNYMKDIESITGREYAPFVYYGDPLATDIIVAMGSVCETIKETIDSLGSGLGLIEVHLYRPFSEKYFMNVLPNTVKRIAVLDRTKEPGSTGEPLFLDVCSIVKDKDIKVIGGRYGLSSKDTNPSHIKAVYDLLRSDKIFHGFTVGIIDDVTNLSLEVSEYDILKDELKEFLIYGFGSDGMVGASKDIIKLVGDNTPYNVQGYFQYDSKKSGGLTRSHLRVSKNPIRSTYFVNHPSLVVCSKEAYLGKYDMFYNIRENGTFIYVTSMSELEVDGYIPDDVRNILISRNIKFYIIDAYELANKHGLKDKISTVLETCILKVIGLIDYDLVINKMKESIRTRFKYKGEDVVLSNINVIEESLEYLKEVKITDSIFYEEKNKTAKSNNKIFDMMEDLKGNDLKVSDFIDYRDGTYITATSKYEKRGIAESVPTWIPENCIQCNQCAFVCPHAVIRPYLLNEEEYNNAPDSVKKDMLDAFGSQYKFKIEVSTLDCTGCTLCYNACPGKGGEKALKMVPFDDVNHNNGIDYLMSINEKKDMVKNTVKGTQFSKPAFEFSGACAGCGETPYIRLLTQLFKDKMIIANATGCTSIYGASMPSMPYNVPWASSLFEDNAEFGYGMVIATNTIRNRIANIMENNIDDPVNGELYKKWLAEPNNYEVTKEVYENLDYSKSSEIAELKEYIKSRSIWMLGGDGWAYDIGFGGIDHVLSSGDNVNILVLDTEVYSNTGGQASKASNKGAIAKFASSGKKTSKKDLAKIAMCYPNTYVAQISMGANMQQTINALIEAEKHDGPSIIIAYSTCISHGIKGGMEKSTEQQKQAVQTGYFPIFRYNPTDKKFTLDTKEPNFDSFNTFLESQNRFAMLKTINEEKANILFEELKNEAIERYKYYKGLSEVKTE